MAYLRVTGSINIGLDTDLLRSSLTIAYALPNPNRARRMKDKEFSLMYLRGLKPRESDVVMVVATLEGKHI